MGVNPFKPATKAQSKLRMAITGTAGCGKTFTALSIASAFGKIACIDTERGSASKYAGIFTFDVLELEKHDPEEYVKAIKAAVEYGYEVLVIDSMSHAWSTLLERVDAITKRSTSGNKFTAWADITPVQNNFIDTILSAPLHIIATMRAKTEYAMESETRNGRTVQVPKKIGLAPIQRDQVDYEFDIMAMMDGDQNMTIIKTRCPSLTGMMIQRPNADDLGVVLKTWLTDGAEIPDDILSKWKKVVGVEGDKEEIHWASDFQVFNTFKNNLLTKLTGIGETAAEAESEARKVLKIENWSGYATAVDAGKAARAAWEAWVAKNIQQPPTTPPVAPEALTPSAASTDLFIAPRTTPTNEPTLDQSMSDYVARVTPDILDGEILQQIGKTWAQIGNRTDAETEVNMAIVKYQRSFVCSVIRYMALGQGKKIEFVTPNNYGVKLPGGMGALKTLLGADADAFFAAHPGIEDSKLGTTPIRLNVPLMIDWVKDEKNNDKVTNVEVINPPNGLKAAA